MNDVSLFVNDKAFSSALLERETSLRKKYINAGPPLSIVGRASQPRISLRAPKDVSVEDTLQDSAAFLELLVVLGAWFEAAEELGLRTLGEVMPHGARLAKLTHSITGYDPAVVAQQNAHRFPQELLQRTPDPHTPMRADAFVNQGEVAVATCPIAELERHATRIGEPALGHRCRRAFDSLAASTRRIRLNRDHVGRVLGAAYRDGRLTAYELAAVMQVTVVDAIAFLDEHGFARSVDKLQLTDAERARVFQKMRSDRIARNGSPPANAGDVAVRNVIASQRIEAVDARRWLPPRS